MTALVADRVVRPATTSTPDSEVAGEDAVADLWASAEPEKGLFVTAIADCGEGAFVVAFSPDGAAVVRQGRDVLARASVTYRGIDCDAPIRALKSTRDERPWRGGRTAVSYDAATLRCRTNALLQVAVYPTYERNEIHGSVLLVADRETRQIIASAVLLEPEPTASPGTSRIYYAPDACSRT